MVAVSELVFGLDAELVRLGYKASTMVWYRGCWRRLQRFFASRGVQEFSLEPKLRTAQLARQPLTSPSRNYAQRSTAAALLTSGNGPALHITQRCS
jgi:hypothetical protein